jgi:RNA polymerase sigma factor (sigma-70 family)
MQEVWVRVNKNLSAHQFYDPASRRCRLSISDAEIREEIVRVAGNSVSLGVKRRKRLDARFVTLSRAKDASVADERGGSLPLDQLILEEERKLVALAMASIDKPLAEILRQKYGDGAKSREIANRLGVSESNVSKQLARARAMLAAALERLRGGSGVP